MPTLGQQRAKVLVIASCLALVQCRAEAPDAAQAAGGEPSAAPSRRLSKGGLRTELASLQTELPGRSELTADAAQDLAAGHYSQPGGAVQERAFAASPGSQDPAYFRQQLALSPEERPPKGLVLKIFFGVLLVFLALPIQWFNEDRSARVQTLIARGLSECKSVDSDKVSKANFGRLVHVQGTARAREDVKDMQFNDAVLSGCLKLQSTVEVFEWTQRTAVDARTRRNLPRNHREWTTHHQDSARFRKPSPDNPRLPSGILLGTFTHTCSKVELGAFTFTEDMLKVFHSFEPAMDLLPSKVHAAGLVFFANPKDGYYYARPGMSVFVANPGPELMVNHEVGDLRARFMRVPEGDATIVAVQCDMASQVSFVPYRPITRGLCNSDMQERIKLVEEGYRLKDLRHEGTCCTGGVATCCCCPCNSIACCCSNEVVTEEIFYTAEGCHPPEKPFQRVVARNPCRVWNFRLLGWAVMYAGLILCLAPFNGSIGEAPSLSAYGGGAAAMLAAILTLAAASLIMAVVNGNYRPMVGAQWFLVMVAIIVVPLVASSATASRRG